MLSVIVVKKTNIPINENSWMLPVSVIVVNQGIFLICLNTKRFVLFAELFLASRTSIMFAFPDQNTIKKVIKGKHLQITVFGVQCWYCKSSVTGTSQETCI